MRKNPLRRPEKIDWKWNMNHNTASISRFLDSFEDEDGSPPESVYSDSRLNFIRSFIKKSQNQFGTGARRPVPAAKSQPV